MKQALIAGAAVLFTLFISGCNNVTVWKYAMHLDDAFPLVLPRPTTFVPAELNLGPFEMSARPADWNIRVKEVRRDTGEPLAKFEITGHGTLGVIHCTAWLPFEDMTMRDIGGGFNQFRGGRPDLTPEEFRQKHPTDRAIMIACSQLPPGDLSRDEAALAPHEQEQFVLAWLWKRARVCRSPARVPIWLRTERYDAFISYEAMGDISDDTYVVRVVIRTFPTGVDSAGLVVLSLGVEEAQAAASLRQLKGAAILLLQCLAPASDGQRDTAKSSEAR